MDLPIQVAVRIYPCQTLTPAEEKIEPTADGVNGNSSCDAERNNPKLLIGRNHRCCVEAIPLTAANILSGCYQPPGLPPVQLANGIASGIVQVGPHSFPVTYALPKNCTQAQVYHQTVFPLISLFLEGFDASVVMYGQRGTGKSYTLFGSGFSCMYNEPEQGVVQRCIREIFSHMVNHPDRTYAVTIGWVEICGQVIRDLLGMNNIRCQTMDEVFQWMQLGFAARLKQGNSQSVVCHSLFTLTLEQKWVSKEGLIQHRLSTASFSDLCGTDRICLLNQLEQPTNAPKDNGLQALEKVVHTLTDPALIYGINANGNIPYQQTTLTTLLKDSFGGRAQTLVILCVSPLERDISETIYNLQFAFKVQCVRNFVVMNTFSDDNTPFTPELNVPPNLKSAPIGANGVPLQVQEETFGLQFAANQWFKLVCNAEGLFSKLITSNALTKLDKEQIEEWLFLKQECEECLNSNEASRSPKQLGPIQEAEEPDESVSEAETFCQQISDNESDSESQQTDLAERLDTLMVELRQKTDHLIENKYKDFLRRQPKAVMESQESLEKQKQQQEQKEKSEIEPETEAQKTVEKMEDTRRFSLGGRRRSIQPGVSLSSAEIAMLNRVASREQHQQQQINANCIKMEEDNCYLESSGDSQQLHTVVFNTPLDNVQKKLRKLDTDIEARERQIKEIEQTMKLKQNIIVELVKNNDTRATAKQRFNKKKNKLEAEYEKTKRHLAKSIVQGKDKNEIERLRDLSAHIEQRLQDLISIRNIASESSQKVKKLQQSVHESKKFIDELQKKVKKEKKVREQLEVELKSLRGKENRAKLTMSKAANSNIISEEQRGKSLKDVQARISHLDHVLKEKSENLEQYGESEKGEKEGLRHEIRNLRRTRDHLLEQRCSLDRKLKREKMLTEHEERKLLECDEAIEAIDAAIEFKNELICGHKSIDTSERLQREKGEQMLMARLNKLTPEEMRTLLYKYFTKVIDLRDSSHKLEVQVVNLERERDSWEWKERVLSNAVRQARLEGERNAVILQRQHETKLTLMLRHLAEESSANSSYNDQRVVPHMIAMPTTGESAAYIMNATTTTNNSAISPQYTSLDYDGFDIYNNVVPTVGGATPKILKSKQQDELEMLHPLFTDALTKYKPLDKLKEKERETRNKLFSKFHVLTRYGGHTAALPMTQGSHVNENCAGANNDMCVEGNAKKKDKHQSISAPPIIPQENLKCLMSDTPSTKVTRQKNKIIIQNSTRRN